MTMIGIQTRLLVQSKLEIYTFVWVFITSLVWGYLIRLIIIDSSVIISYAFGTALGALMSKYIGKKLENKYGEKK